MLLEPKQPRPRSSAGGFRHPKVTKSHSRWRTEIFTADKGRKHPPAGLRPKKEMMRAAAVETIFWGFRED